MPVPTHIDHHAVLLLAPAQAVRDRRGANRAGRAQRMAERDRAAQRIDLRRIEPEVAASPRAPAPRTPRSARSSRCWSCSMPVVFSTLGIAAIGPTPMISGATPATAKPTQRASGVRFELAQHALRHEDRRARAVGHLRAVAGGDRALGREHGPQLREALGARVGARPLVARDDLRRASTILSVARSGASSSTVIGLISASNSPAACAASAFWCDASANASCASRDTFHCAATFSAVSPMP